MPRSDVLREFVIHGSKDGLAWMRCPGCDDEINITNMDQATKAVVRHMKRHAADSANLVDSQILDEVISGDSDD